MMLASLGLVSMQYNELTVSGVVSLLMLSYAALHS